MSLPAGCLDMGIEPAGRAKFSPCGKYRYLLTRTWGGNSQVAFVMLNPSTADAEKDDPTIRKCIGFAKRWGFGRLVVVNLFAYRSTDPRNLKKVDDPTGPENEANIFAAVTSSERVVLAWGIGGDLKAQGDYVKRIVTFWNPRVYAFGFTQSNQPMHPLYIPYERALVRIPIERMG